MVLPQNILYPRMSWLAAGELGSLDTEFEHERLNIDLLGSNKGGRKFLVIFLCTSFTFRRQRWKFQAVQISWLRDSKRIRITSSTSSEGQVVVVVVVLVVVGVLCCGGGAGMGRTVVPQNKKLTRSLTWGCNVSSFPSAHVRNPPCWQQGCQHGYHSW